MTCSEPSRRIDDALLAILACPASQGDLTLQADKLESVIPSKVAGRVEGFQYKIVCAKCGRRYPVKDGIPVLLVDEAEKPTKL